MPLVSISDDAAASPCPGPTGRRPSITACPKTCTPSAPSLGNTWRSSAGSRPRSGSDRAIEIAQRAGDAPQDRRQGRQGRRWPTSRTKSSPCSRIPLVEYIGEIGEEREGRVPGPGLRPALPDRLAGALRPRDDRVAGVRDAGHRLPPRLGLRGVWRTASRATSSRASMTRSRAVDRVPNLSRRRCRRAFEERSADPHGPRLRGDLPTAPGRAGVGEPPALTGGLPRRGRPRVRRSTSPARSPRSTPHRRLPIAVQEGYGWPPLRRLSPCDGTTRAEGEAPTRLRLFTDIIAVENRFYILAESSLADERTRVLKHGDTFAVFDHYGDIKPVGLGEEGLYHEGTRYLSDLAARLAGERPLFLSSTVRDDNDLLAVDLTNPDIVRATGRGPARHAAHRRAEVPLGRGLPRAADASATTASRPVDVDAVAPLRGRLRRHLRGPRHEAATARRAPPGRRGDGPRRARLPGPRRRASAGRCIQLDPAPDGLRVGGRFEIALGRREASRPS